MGGRVDRHPRMMHTMHPFDHAFILATTGYPDRERERRGEKEGDLPAVTCP